MHEHVVLQLEAQCTRPLQHLCAVVGVSRCSCVHSPCTAAHCLAPQHLLPMLRRVPVTVCCLNPAQLTTVAGSTFLELYIVVLMGLGNDSFHAVALPLLQLTASSA
jgi:hypothetical protein